ncbi:hypothetical protein C8T65DRAFT_745187 [Cerioporus squamosus]|nr:hypothetical protein C8T65DRAFT_745187 [Cerioporus squamosus]
MSGAAQSTVRSTNTSSSSGVELPREIWSMIFHELYKEDTFYCDRKAHAALAAATNVSHELRKEAERYLRRVVRFASDPKKERTTLSRVTDYVKFPMPQRFMDFMSRVLGDDPIRSAVEDITLYFTKEYPASQFDTTHEGEKKAEAKADELGIQVLSLLHRLGVNLRTLRISFYFAYALTEAPVRKRKGEAAELIQACENLETLVIFCREAFVGLNTQDQLWSVCNTFSRTLKHLRIDMYPVAILFSVPMQTTSMNKTLCDKLVSLKISFKGSRSTNLHEFWPCGWVKLGGITLSSLEYLEVDESKCESELHFGGDGEGGGETAAKTWAFHCPRLHRFVWIPSYKHHVAMCLKQVSERQFQDFMMGLFGHFTTLRHFGHTDLATISKSPPYLVHIRDDAEFPKLRTEMKYNGDLWDRTTPAPAEE